MAFKEIHPQSVISFKNHWLWVIHPSIHPSSDYLRYRVTSPSSVTISSSFWKFPRCPQARRCEQPVHQASSSPWTFPGNSHKETREVKGPPNGTVRLISATLIKYFFFWIMILLHVTIVEEVNASWLKTGEVCLWISFFLYINVLGIFRLLMKGYSEFFWLPILSIATKILLNCNVMLSTI